MIDSATRLPKRLVTVACVLLAALAMPLAAAPDGEHLGTEHEQIGATRVQLEDGKSHWAVIEQATHAYAVMLADGTRDVVYRYQYTFYQPIDFEEAPRGGRVVLFRTDLLEQPRNAADFDALLRGPDDPDNPDDPNDQPSDAVQEVIDELEGYKFILNRFKARAKGLDKVKLCTAIDSIDVAIAGLRNLDNNETEIEAALDFAIHAICCLEPTPNSSLDRVKKALINLRAHLF